MVIDRSALIAIALGEPSRQSLLDAIDLALNRIISSVSLLEAGIILRARLGEPSLPIFYELIEALAGEIVPFDVTPGETGSHLPLGVLGRGWATKRN
jgi:uncharacterized protein with PIN domain